MPPGLFHAGVLSGYTISFLVTATATATDLRSDLHAR